MTTLIVAWFVFPLVLGALSLGCGLLVDRLFGSALPGTLLLPVGFAAVIVVATLAASVPSTAKLALPSVVGLAVVGLGLTYPWSRRPERWSTCSTILVFLAYGAPVLLTGTATFAGYIKLDDTATWVALADNALVHGRSLAGLGPSTYSSVLSEYINHGYPLGSMVPLGIGAKLVGEDMLWVFQAYLAFQAALLALTFQGLLDGVVRSPRNRSIVVFLAAQPALLYGYVMWGGIKEIVTVPLLALTAALVARVMHSRLRFGDVLPLAVAVAAIAAVLNVGGGVWIGLALLPVLALVPRMPPRLFITRAAGFAVLVVVLASPALRTAHAFLAGGTGTLTAGTELGTLLRPLSWLQIFGVWPVGDFRARPHDMFPTYILIAIVCLGGAWALFRTLHRASLALPLYVAVSVVGGAVLISFGSPWVDGKALATASPALLLIGLAGAALAFEQGFRVEAAIAGSALAAAVLWTTALAYHEVWLAPRAQLAELQRIGSEFAGQGPALVTEFQPYGTKHLLRRLDPENPGGIRARQDFLANGQTVINGGFADIDAFAADTLAVFPLLVVDRSPVGSRPPSSYALAWQGRFYDVWRRDPAAPQILRHLSLGDDLHPSAVPSCASVLALARLAKDANGQLAVVRRAPAVVVTDLVGAPHPAPWFTSPGGGVYPNTPGVLDTGIDVPTAGTYGVWLGGSYPGKLEISVDGVLVGSATHRLQHPGQYALYGEVALSAGSHDVTIRYLGSSWRPGTNAHLLMPMGPLVLSTATDESPVELVSPAAAQSLCGKSLDWVEALSRT